MVTSEYVITGCAVVEGCAIYRVPGDKRHAPESRRWHNERGVIM